MLGVSKGVRFVMKAIRFASYSIFSQKLCSFVPLFLLPWTFTLERITI